MAQKFSRRWLHPQTVPRGFLRLYIMTQLSKGSQTGYSLMQKIEVRTEGAWRPGPGTMYPLLKGLVKEGLARTTGSAERPGVRVYVLTSKGKKELEEIRESFAGAGRKEPVMARLFSDLLPGDAFLQMVIRRYREGSETLRQKLAELPARQREVYLKELRNLAEDQIAWIDTQLSHPRGKASRGRGASQPMER